MKKIILTCLPVFLLLYAFPQGAAVSNTHSFNSNNNGFTENNGQVYDQNNRPNTAVKYLLTAAKGMNVQLKENSFSYDTYTTDATILTNKHPELNVRKLKQDSLRYSFHRVDISLPGAASHPKIIAGHPFSNVSNFYTHDNRSIQVRSYKTITYQSIYPGIDLVFDIQNTASERGFEYYFVVHPGGNPALIRLQYEGALSVKNEHNCIALIIKSGTIKEKIPASWLLDDDKNYGSTAGRQEVSVRYKKFKRNVYGLDITNYNKRKTLVIDPTPDLIWGTYYGGYNNDWAYDLTRDQQGNIFIGGGTDNSSGIATSGAYQTTMVGFSDAMIGKFTSDGKLVWATYFGGSNEEAVKSLITDADGNLYVVGNTFSPDNIATPGAFKTVKNNPAFVSTTYIAKFDNDGHRIWSTYCGGEAAEQCGDIVLDKNNDLIVSGGTTSYTGIATAGAYQATFSGDQGTANNDLYLMKFNRSGQRIWGTYYGGTGDDRCWGLAINSENHIYLTGGASSNSNFATVGALQTTPASANKTTVFIARFTADGAPVWCTYYGKGVEGGVANSIVCDDKDNIYVGGSTSSTTNIATPGAYQPVIGDFSFYGDGFLAKFSSTGSLKWGTYYGGSSSDDVYGVVSDGKNNVWITGRSGSSINIATAGSYQPSYEPMGGDAFVAKFDSSGSRKWGTYYGKGGYDNGEGRSIITDGKGNVYICGQTSATKNVATCGAVRENWSANQDAFVAEFGESVDTKLPTVTIASGVNGLICPGTVASFTASILNAGNNPTYQWMINTSKKGTNSPDFSTTELKTGDSVTCIIITNSVCIVSNPVTSNSIKISVAPVASPGVTIVASADSICKGSSVSFAATTTNAGSDPSFKWLLNGAAMNEIRSAYVTDSLKDGDIVQCILTKHAACSLDSVATSEKIRIKVVASLVPSVSISVSKDSVCAGTIISFAAVAKNAGANPVYTWQVNATTVSASGANFSSADLRDGDRVQCRVQPVNAGCVAAQEAVSNTVRTTVYPLPVISISGDTILTKGAHTMLSANVSGNIVSYKWTPDSTLSSNSLSSTIASPATSTDYILKVASADGCTAAQKISVHVISIISVPSAFTPGNDGMNDLFRPIYGSDIKHVVFKIYNRYGQQVFADNGSLKGWDGTFNGVPQPAGTYVWLFNYVDVDGKLIKKKGTVILVR